MADALTVYAPASIGNFSVGFDAIGLALAPVAGGPFGDRVTISGDRTDAWSLTCAGKYAPDLPADAVDNVVMAACSAFAAACAEKGRAIEPLTIHLDKGVPAGSGLGSSAASIVATCEALNRHFDYPLGAGALLGLMVELEGGISGEEHLDNIAPCAYGGLRLCPPGSAVDCVLPWPAPWRVVVCWPGEPLTTREMRAVLPDSVPRRVAVRHAAQFAQFVHALHCGDGPTAAECMRDLIAEPYRRSLMPGFDEAREALVGLGAKAVGIAGSGPTVFAVVDDFDAGNRAAEWLSGHYVKNERGFVRVCRADPGGARSIHHRPDSQHGRRR